MPWLLVSLAVIVIVVALCTDGGRLMEERRRAQAVADAAALAAAGDLYRHYADNQGLDPHGTARAAARATAADNGVTSGVTVNIPPTSGAFADQADYAEVLIQSDVNRGFSAVLGKGDIPVRARSVARGRPKKIGLRALHPSRLNAFSASGLGSLRVVRAPIVVNSNSLVAYLQLGLRGLEAERHSVTGLFQLSLGVLGPILSGVDPSPDPLQALPAPNVAAYPVRSLAPLTLNGPGPYTLQPGVYRGGIQISSDCTVTLQAGVYYLDGGGLQISSNPTVTGDGVLLYNAGDVSADQVALAGNGTLALSAATGGPYQGMLLFQERAVDKKVYILGNARTRLEGVVYAPAAEVEVRANGTTGNWLGSGYIGSTLTISGVGGFRVEAGRHPPALPDVGLSE